VNTLRALFIQRCLPLIFAFALSHGAAYPASDWLEKGQRFENDQQWSQAFSAYTEAVKHEPNNAQALYRLGVVNDKLGSTEAAVQSYQAALRVDPGLSEARTALAGYYTNQGVAQRLSRQFTEAIQSFRAALGYDTASANAHFELAQTLEQNGQFDEAVGEYQETVKLDPTKNVAHLRLAKTYSARGQHENAATEYQEALRLNPEDPVAHHGLGVAYNELGKKDQAIASLQQAVRFYLIAGQRDKAQPAYDLQKKLMLEKAGQAATPPQKKK
jgi:tetratricopeptide (TPR) repeat protein